MKFAEIKTLLPWCMQQAVEREESYAGLVEVMELLHSEPEEHLSDFAACLNPRRTPDRFVNYLLGWFGMDWVAGHVSQQNLRLLMEHNAELTRSRGTKEGLELFLHLACGNWAIQIEDEPQEFHFKVYVPASLEGMAGTVRKIVEYEKPAHLSYELVLPEEE